MKTKFIVMAAMAAMFSMGFTACSNNDEDLTAKQDMAEKYGIGFDVKADGVNVTRGLATSSGTIQFTNFQTWAYDALTDGRYMGTTDAAGITVANTGTALAPAWTYSPTQFWPVNALNFVALAPAAPNGVSANACSVTSHVVTLTSTIALSTNVEDQDDIMYAAARAADDDPNPGDKGVYGPVTKADHNGDVPLNFQHALSQIVFQGKLPDDGTVTEVEIAEISLGNIPSAGSLTFTSAGAFYGGNTTITPTTPAVFSLDADDLEGSHFEIGGTLDNAEGNVAFTLTTSEGTKPTAKPGNAWFMLPQALTAWVPASASERKAGGMTSAPATGAYLKVRATLKKDGVTILNNDQPVYIPIDQTWERSKKYIYTIMFNGTGALTEITFSVTAEDWTPASPQPGDLSF